MLTVPLLHVQDMTAAIAFYRNRLGFEVMSDARNEPNGPAGYAVLGRDDVGLHLSSYSGDARPGGVAVIFVHAVDAVWRELKERGLSLEASPFDKSWGTREFYVRDPDGNQLRFTEPLSRTEPLPRTEATT